MHKIAKKVNKKQKRFTVNGKSFNKAIVRIVEIGEGSSWFDDKLEGTILHIGDEKDNITNMNAIEGTVIRNANLNFVKDFNFCSTRCTVEILWSI